MWRSNLAKMKFKLKEGDEVFVYGAINLYVPRGEFKLIATEITPSGIGELQLAFERLKEELEKLGYFKEELKKPLPRFPKRVAIITSKTGAAIEDMKRVASKRWKLTEFYLFDTLVQGEGAAEDIAKNIKRADNFRFEDGKGFDIIIIGRGGGSKEDLWAFNERVVADAVFEANTPIVSAVGHEIDFLISDFVADVRAATPSNAIEIILPDKDEILQTIARMYDMFEARYINILQKKEAILKNLKEVFFVKSPINKIEEAKKEIDVLSDGFRSLIKVVISKKEMNLDGLKREIKIKSPKEKVNKLEGEIRMLKEFFNKKSLNILESKIKEVEFLKNSFSISDPRKKEKVGFAEIVKDGKRIAIENLQVNDEVYLQNTKTKLKTKIIGREDVL
jgi:exodeoxyribonuclease VII large subunit